MAEEFSAPEVAAGPPLGTQTVYYRGPKWFDDIEKILLEEGKVGFGVIWKSLSKSSAYASQTFLSLSKQLLSSLEQPARFSDILSLS